MRSAIILQKQAACLAELPKMAVRQNGAVVAAIPVQTTGSRRFLQACVLIAVWSALVPLSGAYAQSKSSPDIRVLLGRLNDPADTHPDTIDRILAIAKRDRNARQYAIDKLPDMIRGPESDVWENALRLAGKLRAKETIPALIEVMSRDPLPAEPYITFSGVYRLDNDIVAKTLSQIGDPAIPAVRDLLKNKDSGMRYRAILILRNIGSPSAREALKQQRSVESDPENVKLIDEKLEP
jgi:HEAT repeat protein